MGMNYILLVNAAILAFLGSYIYWQRRDRMAAVFMLYTFSTGVWNVCIFLLEERVHAIPVNFVSQIQLTSALLFFNGLYYFVSHFSPGSRTIPLWLSSSVAAVFLVLIYFTEFVTVASIRDGAVYFADGKGYLIYAIYLIVVVHLALYSAFKIYRGEREGNKVQVSYLMAAIVFVFYPAIFFCLILPLLGVYELLHIGYWSSALAPLIFGYAISKHELLDIDVVIKRNTAAILSGATIIVSFVLIYSLFHLNPTLYFFSNIMLGLFWAFAGKRLQELLITTAKRRFVKGWYDPEDVITSLSKALAVENNRERIFKLLQDSIDQTFQLESISRIVVKRGEDNKLSHYHYIDDEKKITVDFIALDDSILDVFKKNNDIVAMSKAPDSFTRFLTEHKVNVLALRLAIPFSSPEGLEGVIILGERSIGKPFSELDMDFFERLQRYISAILYRLTPFEALENQYFSNQKKLHEAEIQVIRAKKIEAIAHATRQCHHEVRTPLNIIQLGVKRVKTLEDLEQFKDVVKEETDRALEIINETLTITDVAKPDDSTIELVDVNAAINRCLKIIPKSGYTISKSLQQLPKILGKERDIEVVFTNLANNALAAMGDGGHLNIKSYIEYEQIVIEVEDNGCGIPESIRQSIWEPYTSGHRTKTGNETAGRGWGMTIVHRIITEHEGTINFESEEGVGTKFIIHLPIDSFANEPSVDLQLVN